MELQLKRESVLFVFAFVLIACEGVIDGTPETDAGDDPRLDSSVTENDANIEIDASPLRGDAGPNTGPIATPALEVGLVQESNEGMDGSIFWQSVFLLNDGRIASFGTGNHVHDQTNSIRCIDPVREPGVLHYYNLFPWTRDESGKNLYATNYDNHPSIYIPTRDLILWVGHGVFDVAEERWLYGDRPPFEPEQNWDGFIKSGPWASAYNPSVAWCNALGVGVFFGNSGGGYGTSRHSLSTVELNPNYPATETQPWHVRTTEIDGIADLHRSRNTAVCLGDQLFVLGPLSGPYTDDPVYAFYHIDVSTRTLVATLTPPSNMGNAFPQLVYDSHRDRLVLLGRRLAVYRFGMDSWTDVSPDSWRGYLHPMGVYHPSLDVILFRGRPRDIGNETPRPDFGWNRITFTN